MLNFVKYAFKTETQKNKYQKSLKTVDLENFSRRMDLN